MAGESLHDYSQNTPRLSPALPFLAAAADMSEPSSSSCSMDSSGSFLSNLGVKPCSSGSLFSIIISPELQNSYGPSFEKSSSFKLGERVCLMLPDS